jgi:hypothetical protein
MMSTGMTPGRYSPSLSVKELRNVFMSY